MLPFVFRDEIAAGLSLGAFFLWLCVEYWLVVRDRGHVHARQDHGSKRVLIISCWAALALGITLSLVVPSASFKTHPWTPVGLGVTLMVFGVSLRLWSVRVLGRFFRRTVMVQGVHRVIQDGPYRFVRHPSYTGFLLASMGLSLVLANWLALVVQFAIVFLAFLQRIAVEEGVLSAELGEPYQSYMKRTKRLIPFMY
jgi:protein-S-isoprenylcysteine O-methyltransferase Ste14